MAGVFVGCGPKADGLLFHDSYSEMQAVCDWSGYRERYSAFGELLEGPSWAEGVEIPAFPSEACIDRVIEDFGLDVDAFLAADGLSDPYGPAQQPGPIGGGLLISGPLGGIRGLLLMETDDVDDYYGHPLVSDTYVQMLSEVAAQTDATTWSAAEYNFVTTIVQHVQVGDDEADARFDRESGTLYVSEPWCCGDARSQRTLVHEAGHHLHTHVPCDYESAFGSYCDETYDEAYGMGIASLAVLQAKYSSAEARSLFGDATWGQLHLVHAINPGGTLLPDWEAKWEEVFQLK